MAKILLVEDDNNLREIYEARLQAEGYAIVSAHDGEEALVVAKAEKPDLIISDVMMPKISGFEMLDILRNTDTLKHVKIIMLTALGQSDDQQRANKLGADRYLVKSQVTLEDIVNVANELLQSTQPANGSAPATAPAASTDDSAAQQPSDASPPATPTAVPVTPAPSPTPDNSATSPASTTEPVSIPVASPTETVADQNVAAATSQDEAQEEAEVKSQINNFISTPTPAKPISQTIPVITDDEPKITSNSAAVASKETAIADEQPAYSPQPVGKRVIEPLPESQVKPDLNTLLEKENAKEILEKSGQQVQPQAAPAINSIAAPTEPAANPASAAAPASDDLNNIAL